MNPATTLSRSRPWVTAVLAMLVVSGPAAGTAFPAEAPQPVQVTKEAWFTAPTKDALPPILVSEFPPGVVCILVPESCSEDAEVVTSEVETVLRESEIPAGPVHPVAPDTLPVGVLGGHRRYASLISFTLPPAPADALVEQFDLILNESGLNYALESPAFRELVRAFVAQAADEPSLDPFQRFLDLVVSQEASLLETEPTGLEACAVIEQWDEGENREIEALPEIDCAFGANGVRAEDGTWTFDLSIAVQAWLDGTIPNHGIYIGPVTPPNVEYGDPDPSTNFQVSVAGGEADEESRPTFVAAFGTFPAGGSGGAGAGFAPSGSAGSGGGPGFAPAPPGAPLGLSAESGGAGSPPLGGGEGSAPPPVPASSAAPYIPGWMWGLVALGVIGAIGFSRVVGLESSSSMRRAGALSRLVGSDLS